ncbi:autophagy protein 12-like [Anabrus simplex]|uniref:autophagy protein 12-like n=1 Tax=Anabrus simplex TaxID=316456 RepID=UPI0035A32297
MADNLEVPSSENIQESVSPSSASEAGNEPPPAESAAAGDGTVLKPSSKQKIDILLKATGNAPIMKKKKWAVESDQTIKRIINFIRKYLKLDSQETLFLYINQAFAPAPDQTIRNLYECYGTDGKLVLHYCKSPAWG